ncbi:MAG: hypothetical protein L6R37_006646 [Teloschistes peruensis]|nr:MAG: hypothetical protein L6R37_006646 [Teloschistes peruensis]
MPSKKRSNSCPSTPSRDQTPANPQTPGNIETIPYIPTIEGTLGREKTLDERVTLIPCPPDKKGSLIIKPNMTIQKALKKAKRALFPPSTPSYQGVMAFRASLANTSAQPSGTVLATPEAATPGSVPQTKETPHQYDPSSPIGAAVFSTARPTLPYATTPSTPRTPSPSHRATSPPGTHTPLAPRSTRKSEEFFRSRHAHMSPPLRYTATMNGHTHGTPSHHGFASSPLADAAVFSTYHPSTTLAYPTTPYTLKTPSPNHRATTPPGTHTPLAPYTDRASSEFYLAGRPQELSPSRRYIEKKTGKKVRVERSRLVRSRSASPARTTSSKTKSARALLFKKKVVVERRAARSPSPSPSPLRGIQCKKKKNEEKEVEGGANVTGEMGPPSSPFPTHRREATTTHEASASTIASAAAHEAPLSTPKKHRATLLHGMFKNLKRARAATPSPVKKTTGTETNTEEGVSADEARHLGEDVKVDGGKEEGEEPRTPGRKRVKGQGKGKN